ncbi:porin [Cupriavidus alkaliphilus]|uniref:porin n=1 Tax=Cupriavidus alkaliphilus TaxID=942866 RepID=UPI00160FB234|nr:porin [Cupriavidus alkaliphilus]MBB3014074.1 putative porin [Cupriavidus alkaliphilus]
MKKTMFAMAALAALTPLSGAAQAPSNVTLYGVVDTAVEYVNHMASAAPTVNNATGTITRQTGGNRFALVNSGGLSGSRWGLRGTEALGNGLSAIFTLESGFGADDGKSSQGGRLFGRQAFVGLQSDRFGAVTFGRQYTSMFDAFASFAPLSYAPLYDPSSYLLGPAFRSDNTIKYSGTFGPVTAVAHWTFGAGATALGVVPVAGSGGETPGHFRDSSGYGAAVIYASGPLGLTVTYDQWNPAITAGNAGRVRKAGGAMTYVVGPAKLFAGYRWGQAENSVDTTLFRDDMYWVGANYSVNSALVLKLAYYYDNLKTVRIGQTAAATNPANPWQVSFTADYNLSKRTDVYLSMAYAKNAGLNFDSSPNGFASGYFLQQGSNNQFGSAIGIRHRF